MCMPPIATVSTVTWVLIAIVALSVALVLLLSVVMSRPMNLEPHRHGRTGNRWGLRRRSWQARAERDLDLDQRAQPDR